MKQLSRSKAAAKLFSPAALALAVGLACWGSAALASNKPIPGIDIIVKKNPGGSIVVTPTSDHSGKFSVKLGPGDYTVSTACKSGGCTPSRISIDIKDYNEKLEADGSTSYEFHVGKGGLNLRGQTLSIDPPNGAGANDAPGKANQPIITKDVDNLTTQAFRGNRPLLDEPASTSIRMKRPPPNQLRGKETARAESAGVGDETPHNKYADDFKQINTKLDAHTANSTNGADETPHNKYADDFTQIRGTAPNPNDVDKTPQNKYADDFTQVNTKLDASTAKPTNGGDKTLADQLLGKGADMLKGVKIPDPKAGDRTDPNTAIDKNLIVRKAGSSPPDEYHTASPSKIGNDKPTNKYADDFTQMNTKLEAGTATPPGGDTTPQNKYADDFKQLNTKIDALASQVAGATALTADLSSVKAQVTALQTAIAALPTTTSITALLTSLTTSGVINSKIDAITTTLNTVATAGTATKAVVDGLKTDLTALKTDLTAFTAKVTADNLAMKTQGKETARAESTGVGDETPQNKYADDFKQLNTKLEARTANPTNGGGETPQNKYADDFKQLNTKLDALATQVAGVTTLSTDLSSVKAQITALQTAVAGLPTTASITALQTSLTAVTTKIDAIATTLNTVAAAGTATKALVDGLKTDLTALTTKVAADNRAMNAKVISPPPKNENAKPDNDKTPHNKYADDFKQLNTGRVEKPDGNTQQPGNKDSKNGPGGFGNGMNGSPGSGPELGGMNGSGPGMRPPGAGPMGGGPSPMGGGPAGSRMHP